MEHIKNSHVYGFEEYDKLVLWGTLIDNSTRSYWRVKYYTERGPHVSVIKDNIPFPMKKDWSGFTFEYPLYSDHRELINNAERVYVHPSCGISRSLVQSQYKKSLDPWTADIIVMPDYTSYALYDHFLALFLNDEAHLAVLFNLDNMGKDYISDLKNLPEGIKVSEITKCPTDVFIDNLGKEKAYAVLNSELAYIGTFITFYNKDAAYFDVVTRNIDTSKTVFESSMQEALCNDDNKLDIDSAKSLYDMLESYDNDTIGTAIKTLSMMDYVHYPNSVKYILENANSTYRHNKACNSTAAKYMFKYLTGGTARSFRTIDYDNSIYPEDYELLKELIKYIRKVNDSDFAHELVYFPFICVNDNGTFAPAMRQRI